jgi:hypothetical protein
VEALRRVRAQLPPDARVTVPAVHLFDSANHTIVMDDAGPRALPLKAALLAEGRIAQSPPLALPRAAALGTALGEFLRALHARGREDGAMREAFARHAVGRDISGFATYGRLGATLRALDGCDRGDGDGDADGEREESASASGGGDPDRYRALLRSVLGEEPLGVSEDTLRVVEALAEQRRAQIREPRGGDGETFVMGDFWPGNVLVVLPEEEDDDDNDRAAAPPAPAHDDDVVVVDWELAKVGLAGLDVGQFCAELATLRCLRPGERAEGGAAAGEILANFVRAYFAGDVGPEAEETRRVAVGHFGVHLAVWTARAGWEGGAGPTRALVLDGVARLVEGADADRVWTDEELVQTFLR